MMKWLFIPMILLFWTLSPKQGIACEHMPPVEETSCEHQKDTKPSETDHCDQKDASHQEDHQKTCAKNGACCCVIPLMHNCCIINFDYAFTLYQLHVEPDYQTLRPAFVIAGFSSIFIPPKIA